MTSNMMAGERRWASARRGGMTVLGKVAVPKPLNLPSQRLENHGLDPNVEIVPKGTLSWGSRSSSPASNAWGSSTLSPTADGSSGSPSHLSGRPSSGGSGTRPSTAGSDRTHEPTGNAWGPNSRPSSASGILTSNQTSLTPSRPRTAETRPGSSQLSRFAGPSSDNSVAWGTSGTAEKLGLSSSKNDGFSLSTGDFPTLGSEKDNSGKNNESQDHGSYSRPGSSSGGVATTKDRNMNSPGDVSMNSNVKSGTVDTWKRDGPQHVEDAVQPSSEKWHGEPQHYLNANIPPQHFDAWRGPPINAPAGVWYRGPPGAPPYGAPMAPGGFPIEPFPPYHFQGPPPGAGPRGPRPKSGDFHRPQVPDAFIHPQIRPGFYPGPVPYEGYYGPPVSYCNPGDRDIPFMGMPSGPALYNRYPGQNAPDPNNNYGRAGGHGSSGKAMVSDQAGHLDDTRGPYKVLLKQSSEYGGKEEEGKWEHKKDEDMYSRRTPHGEDAPSRTFEKIGESRGNLRAVDDSSVKKSENVSPVLPLPQVFPATPKDSSLIQKIEGLNAKARTSDGRHDVSISGREEQKNRLQGNVKASHSGNITSAGAVSKGRTHAGGDVISAAHGVDVSSGNKTLQPAAVNVAPISRGASHGVDGRLDHRGKSFNGQETDGWHKKPLAAESTNIIAPENVKPSSNLHVQDQHTFMEATEKSEINPQEKDEGESLTPMFDSRDSQEQRAKMREIAKQRAKQLQEEEEERTREQKAKALAKLEELNRRMQAADGSTQKLEKVPPGGDIQKEHEESQTAAEPAIVENKSEKPSSLSVSNPGVVPKASDRSTIEDGESAMLSIDKVMETLDNTLHEPVVQHGQPLSSQEDAHNAGSTDSKTTRQVAGSSVSRPKRVGYKPKHGVPPEKKLSEKSIPSSTTETPKDHCHVAVDDVASIKIVIGEIDLNCELNSSIYPIVPVESSAQQRRKNSRYSKNKQKLEEAPPVAASPSPPRNEIIPNAKNEIQPIEQRSLPSDEAHGRSSNLSKSQHSRRMPRVPQGNRPADKFHSSDTVKWAPVKPPQNKSEVMDEASLKTVPDAVAPTVKSDNLVQNSLKSKRAEMERYVPKPVAKELAQQGSMQPHNSSSTNQTSSDEGVGRTEPVIRSIESSQPVSSEVVNVGSTSESKNGGGRQSKQSKGHGSWRQRGSTESPYPQGSQDVSSFSSIPGKNVQVPTQQYESSMPDVHSVKEKEKISDEWGIDDGWNIPDYPEPAAPVTSHVLKDQGVSGRGKRHQSKSHKSTGSNYDRDRRNTNSLDTDRSYGQSAAVEMNQTDKIVASKENHGMDEQASHWQPKSQTFAVHNRGSRSSGGQNVTEVGKAVRKDSAHREVNVQSEQKNVAEPGNVGRHEAKRERTASTSKGRTDSPNQGPMNTFEQAPISVDTRHEQRNSSGFRRNGNQNNRTGRGHESGGDWSAAGHDNEQHHNIPANRDRQRYNSHYEYQPKSNNLEGPRDGPYNMGSRYRERGQGQSRRGGGNFYGRQSGTVQVEGGYE